MREPVIRLRASTAGSDRYNDPATTFDVETPAGLALVAPGDSEEVFEPGRSSVSVSFTLYFRNAWPDIKTTDRVRVRGGVYEVLKSPEEWRGDMVGGLVVQVGTVIG